MAETATIARMAEEVSKGIFSIFGWERRPHRDQNWACVTKNHKKKTHPSDAVFSYESPLEHGKVYLTTDLKSYAAATITKDKLEEALKSLSISAECANQSEEWQQIYADTESNFRVYGMLFIYNHDGEYDKNFPSVLSLVKQSLVKVKANFRLFVFGPADITYLTTLPMTYLENEVPGNYLLQGTANFIIPISCAHVLHPTHLKPQLLKCCCRRGRFLNTNLRLIPADRKVMSFTTGSPRHLLMN